MTDHEKTCIRLGKWTPGMKCMCGYRFGQRDTYAHDVPCPPLTSDDISEWLRDMGYRQKMFALKHGNFLVFLENNEIRVEAFGPTLLAALENAVAKIPEESK